MPGKTIDPDAAVSACVSLIGQLRSYGAETRVSFDMNEFERVRTKRRGTAPSPFYKPSLSSFTSDNAMWISITHKGRNGREKVVGLQALRHDFVDRDFRDWMYTWAVGLQVRDDDPVKTMRLKPLQSELADLIQGYSVYHGEFWLKRRYRELNRGAAAAAFCRLGMVMGMMKWQPETMWILVDDRMVEGGTAVRIGYNRIQRNWVEWNPMPAEAHAAVENLAMTTKGDVLNMIADLAGR